MENDRLGRGLWGLLLFQEPRRGILWGRGALLSALFQVQQRADRGEKRRDILDWVHLVPWNNSGWGWRPLHDWEGRDFGQPSTPKIWVIVVCL